MVGEWKPPDVLYRHRSRSSSRCTDQSAESSTFGSYLLTRPPLEQPGWSHTDQSNAPAVGPSPTAVVFGPRVPLTHLTYRQAPILEYAYTAWGNLGTTQVDRLERFQRRAAAKIILRHPLFVPSNHDELVHGNHWLAFPGIKKEILPGSSWTSNGHQHCSQPLERLHPFQAHPHAQQ